MWDFKFIHCKTNKQTNSIIITRTHISLQSDLGETKGEIIFYLLGTRVDLGS